MSLNPSPFKLYPVAQPALSFADYQTIMDEVRAAGARSALEFGPGSSTLALLEGGVENVVTCEYLPKWFDVAVENFRKFPGVRVIKFENVGPVAKVPDLKPESQFPIAFVDSPKGHGLAARLGLGVREQIEGQADCSRLNTCLKALEHAPIVLLHDASRPLERATLGRLNAMGYRHEWVKSASGGSAIARIYR